MKTIPIVISALSFLFFACTKNNIVEEAIEPEKYNKEQIIEKLLVGEWQWIYSTGIP